VKRCASGLLFVFTLGLLFATTAAADIDGEWWTPGFNSRVKIGPCGENLCGVIVWLWEETPKDKIADKQPLVGRQLFVDLKALQPGYSAAGKVYNPEDGHLYRATIELKSQNTLELQGCFLFICTRQVWRRVDPTACPPVAGKAESP
jgi:uncharacterized protein (DUF2147 family)